MFDTQIRELIYLEYIVTRLVAFLVVYYGFCPDIRPGNDNNNRSSTGENLTTAVVGHAKTP
jgi:hypothetical protein